MATTSRPSSVSSTKKSRLSFSGITSGLRSAKRDFLFRRTSGTDTDLTSLELSTGYLQNESYSEVSMGSSASQIKTMSSVVVKKFDKMSTSTRSVLSLRSGIKAGYRKEEAGPDLMSSRGRNLEMILEAGMDVSAKMQTFFEKNQDILSCDRRAEDLRKQNESIRGSDWGMFTQIAICGDNGAGKSSLVNALLDIECITPISSGNSCTATPIEFRTRDRAQKMNAKYNVVSTLLTPTEWASFATQIISDIQEDAADMKCITAREVLRSLFHLPEDANITFEDIQHIPVSCRELAEQLCTQNISEVNDYINRLNSEYWAVLKKITIYMDSPVLNTGVILVDLPGLGKISPRKLVTVNEYLSSCECILVVSDISKFGMDDLFLDPVLEPLARQAQSKSPSQFAFILTQIDNVSRAANDPKWDKKRDILSRVESTREMIHKSPKSRLNSSTVIFTSSLEYQWHHNRLLRPKMASCISPEGSGIPTLRRFIQEKGLQRRDEIVKSLVQGTMSTFMNSVQHWYADKEMVSPEPEEVEVITQEELHMCFEAMQKEIHGCIVDEVSTPLSTLVESLGEKIKNEEELETTAEEARGIVVRWMNACDPWVTIERACRESRQKGFFTDRTNGTSINWCESMANLLINHINQYWWPIFNQDDEIALEMFTKASEKIIGVVSAAIKQSTTDTEKIVAELPNIANSFRDSFDIRRKSWQTSLENVNAIVTGNQAPLQYELNGFYDAFQQVERGQGVRARLRAYATDNLLRFILPHYGKVCNDVSEGLKMHLEELVKALFADMDKILGDLRSRFFLRASVRIKPRAPVDLKPVKKELEGLCKMMKHLDFMVMKPRVAVESSQ